MQTGARDPVTQLVSLEVVFGRPGASWRIATRMTFYQRLVHALCAADRVLHILLPDLAILEILLFPDRHHLQAYFT